MVGGRCASSLVHLPPAMDTQRGESVPKYKWPARTLVEVRYLLRCWEKDNAESYSLERELCCAALLRQFGMIHPDHAPDEWPPETVRP